MQSKVESRFPEVTDQVRATAPVPANVVTASAFGFAYDPTTVAIRSEAGPVAQELGLLVDLAMAPNIGHVADPGSGAAALDAEAKSAFAATLAAAQAENGGRRHDAIRLLQTWRDEHSIPCPTIALHLARLGVDQEQNVSAALRADPLLEPDVRVLDLDPIGRARARRRQLSEEELRAAETALTELRHVHSPDLEPVAGGGPPVGGPCPLALLEYSLHGVLQLCESEVEFGRQSVEQLEREQGRQEDRLAVAARAERAAKHFFVVAVSLSAVAVLTYVVWRVTRDRLMLLSGLSLFALVAVPVAVAMEFRRAWKPYSAYAEIRAVSASVGELQRRTVAGRRQLAVVWNRYLGACRDAQLQMNRVRARRVSVIPSGPRRVNNRPQ